MSRRDEVRIVRVLIVLLRLLDLPPAAIRLLVNALAKEAGGAMVRPAGAQVANGDMHAPEIAGFPRSRFKDRPYVDVCRGLLRDGEKGPVVRSPDDEFFPGATRPVLAHLLQHGQIHQVDALAYQIDNSLGTVASRKKNALGTISKLRRSTPGMGITIERPGRKCHSSEWVLVRQDCQVTFSVDIAREIAARARQKLSQNKPASAATTAIEAKQVDEEVLEVDEVLCQAALMLGPTGFGWIENLKSSVEKLEKRLVHISRCMAVVDRSLKPLVGGQVGDLQDVRARLQAESDRLTPTVGAVRDSFGDLLDGLLPADKEACETTQRLRDLHIGVDRAMSDPLGQRLLDHWRVNRLRDQAESRLPGDCDAAERIAERTWVNAIVMMIALTPSVTPNICCICKGAEFEIMETQDPTDGDDRAEARWARKWDRAKDLQYTIHGERVRDEELARLLRWPWERVKAVLEWINGRHPKGSDYLDRISGLDEQEPECDLDEEPPRNGSLRKDEEPYENPEEEGGD